jgi:hypothetical protein
LFALCYAFREKLQRHKSANLRVFRLMYNTHTASTKFLDIVVVRDVWPITGTQLVLLARSYYGATFGKSTRRGEGYGDWEKKVLPPISFDVVRTRWEAICALLCPTLTRGRSMSDFGLELSRR